MFYYMPVKVYEEKDCVAKHAEELASFGRKALIVTGAHSAKANGSLDDVINALKSEKTEYAIFDKVEENPSVETIMRARDFGLSENADFLIGIGGGSPMDAAKAIAYMMKNKDLTSEALFDKGAVSDYLPVIAVPTTCGTGSEVTGVSVLTRNDIHTKMSMTHKIFPSLALIDAKYLLTASRNVIVNTTMDSFAHLVESYINSTATEFSRDIAITGLKYWSLSREIILNNEKPSYDNLRNMLLASTYGGMAIAHTGTSLPHGLSYALTYNTHMAHGKACGYFIGGYLAESDKEEVGTVLRAAGFSSIDDFNKYYENTCGRDTVSSDILELSIKDILTNPGKQKKAPFPVDEKVLRRIAL